MFAQLQGDAAVVAQLQGDGAVVATQRQLRVPLHSDGDQATSAPIRKSQFPHTNGVQPRVRARSPTSHSVVTQSGEHGVVAVVVPDVTEPHVVADRRHSPQRRAQTEAVPDVTATVLTLPDEKASGFEGADGGPSGRLTSPAEQPAHVLRDAREGGAADMVDWTGPDGSGRGRDEEELLAAGVVESMMPGLDSVWRCDACGWLNSMRIALCDMCAASGEMSWERTNFGLRVFERIDLFFLTMRNRFSNRLFQLRLFPRSLLVECFLCSLVVLITDPLQRMSCWRRSRRRPRLWWSHIRRCSCLPARRTWLTSSGRARVPTLHQRRVATTIKRRKRAASSRSCRQDCSARSRSARALSLRRATPSDA